MRVLFTMADVKREWQRAEFATGKPVAAAVEAASPGLKQAAKEAGGAIGGFVKVVSKRGKTFLRKRRANLVGAGKWAGKKSYGAGLAGTRLLGKGTAGGLGYASKGAGYAGRKIGQLGELAGKYPGRTGLAVGGTAVVGGGAYVASRRRRDTR